MTETNDDFFKYSNIRHAFKLFLYQSIISILLIILFSIARALNFHPYVPFHSTWIIGSIAGGKMFGLSIENRSYKTFDVKNINKIALWGAIMSTIFQYILILDALFYSKIYLGFYFVFFITAVFLLVSYFINKIFISQGANRNKKALRDPRDFPSKKDNKKTSDML